MKINIKNINIKSICATLFISLFLFISCGNAGPVPKEGQAATADGTLINLKGIGDNIKGVVEFVMNIEEVKNLIVAIDELAKGIGKKINTSGSGIEADGSHGNNKNNGLIAGVYEIASLIETKAKGLQVGESFNDKELQTKVDIVKNKAEAFKSTLRSSHSNLGSGSAVTDINAQKAIDRKSHGSDGTYGAIQLAELYEAVNALMSTANEVLKGVIAPAKEVSPAN
ncbi:hypothetical protein bcCo53_001644 (plasmid) [Borrelia coriaceae]|uniref:Variable outer membrane protein n=1 Tax=Borrelia coriaceae ATCC 43381 TaxID=1408429 RepID=W5SWI3_9SPIR|nr:Vsp/OspC family lipoprotein [Borrelia coriaceae]AHH11247.1 Variable outer membrane protein [Borrelia coriaceae ATCC 43381]UPA17441.1 hypothetical protein bcCo53_001644 [Borrelia coriaceae]